MKLKTKTGSIRRLSGSEMKPNDQESLHLAKVIKYDSMASIIFF